MVVLQAGKALSFKPRSNFYKTLQVHRTILNMYCHSIPPNYCRADPAPICGKAPSVSCRIVCVREGEASVGVAVYVLGLIKL